MSFVPTFEKDPVAISTYGTVTHLNPGYFATAETAEELARRYNAVPVEKPYNLARFTVLPPTQWFLRFGKVDVNAGLLAGYFLRNPEDKFPGLADRYAKAIIDSEIKGL